MRNLNRYGIASAIFCCLVLWGTPGQAQLRLEQGGTGKFFSGASAGSLVYSDANSMEWTAVCSSNDIWQSAGTGAPTCYDLFDSATTWTEKHTFTQQDGDGDFGIILNGDAGDESPTIKINNPDNVTNDWAIITARDGDILTIERAAADPGSGLGTESLGIREDGGVVIEGATGDSQGAGTMNVSGGVYENGEKYATLSEAVDPQVVTTTWMSSVSDGLIDSEVSYLPLGVQWVVDSDFLPDTVNTVNAAWPDAGTFSGYGVGADIEGSVCDVTVTLRKNNSATVFTCTVSNGAGNCEVNNTVSVAALDNFEIEIDPSAGCTASFHEVRMVVVHMNFIPS